MNPTMPKYSNPIVAEHRPIKRRQIIGFVLALVLAYLFSSGGFQTYWSKERRLIAAGNEIVTALKAYRDASPGTAKDFPLELADLRHDPRMLAEVSYLAILPIDPVAQKMEWGVLRNKKNQVIGVHSLSNETATVFAKILSLRGGEKYSDWKFVAE